MADKYSTSGSRKFKGRVSEKGGEFGEHRVGGKGNHKLRRGKVLDFPSQGTRFLRINCGLDGDIGGGKTVTPGRNGTKRKLGEKLRGNQGRGCKVFLLPWGVYPRPTDKKVRCRAKIGEGNLFCGVR